MMEVLKTKEGKLLLFVSLIALFIAFKVIKFPISGEVNIEIMQQKGAISNLDSKKIITSTKRLTVPNINFIESRELKHKEFGSLGFKTNFFINATTKAIVQEKGNYTFYIASDDGFRFSIDNFVVCEHPSNRPFKTNVCKATLEKKEYIFKLSYYQGGGPLGLIAKYKLHSKPLLIGTDSKYIIFKGVK